MSETPNPYANFPNMIKTYNEILNYNYYNLTVKDTINNFLNSVAPETTYNLMVYSLIDAINTIIGKNGSQEGSGLKVLVTISDGSVAFDSTKCEYLGSNIVTAGQNNYNNFLQNIINVNHNTRPEVNEAIMFSEGVGKSKRYSATSNTNFLYLAYRQGATTFEALGSVRLAYPTTL